MEKGNGKSLQELVAELLAGKNIESTNVMDKLDTTQNINTDEIARRHAEDNQEEEIDTATIVKSQPFVDDVNNDGEADVDVIADGIMVVTDPEITSEEYEEVADELQGIVDDTDAGKIPFTDKYDGNYILGCPICGGTFVSETLLDNGEDACPICCKVPDSFVVNGKIESEESVKNQNELQNEIDDAESQDDNIEDNQENLPKTLDKNKNLLDNNTDDLDNEEDNETPLKGEGKEIEGNKLQENKLQEDEDLGAVESDVRETVENDDTDEVSKGVIASTIDVLIADEESAIDGYNSYLSQAEQTVSEELFNTLKEQLDEIIADEQEHIEKLNTIKSTLQGNTEVEDKVEDKVEDNVEDSEGETMKEESKRLTESDDNETIVFTTETDYVDQNNPDFKEWLEETHDVESDVQEEAESLGIDESDTDEIDNIRDGLIQSYIEEYEEMQNEAEMQDWDEYVKPMIEKQLDNDDLIILMGTANTWNRHGQAAQIYRGIDEFANMVSDYDSVTITADSNKELNISLGHHDGTHYMKLYTSNQDAEGIYNKLIELGENEFTGDYYDDFDDANSYYDMGDFIDFMLEGHQEELKEFLVPLRVQEI